MNNEFFKGEDPAGLIQRDGAAQVTVSAGYSIGYGNAKCTVSITLTCDQNTEALNAAYQVAFEAANNMAIDGMRRLDQHGESFSTAPGRPG